MGDNITPPQQAFNWVADVYGSTDEIKARGQVIVGLMHENIGHLGIFVSGKVAKKEHAQIVSVLKSIEALPPGLYAMKISERKGVEGKVEYDVSFEERRLEDIVAQAQPVRAQRREALRSRRRHLRLQPACLRALPAAAGAGVVRRVRGASCARQFHPLRMQRWAMSDLNPWLAWLRARRRDGAREARAGRARQCRAQAREDGVDRHQRLARLLPRDARRDERSGVLHDLRQRVLALRRRQARAESAGDASPSRASCRSCRRRWRRSARAVIPRRSRAWRACLRARASRCCCPACR